MTANVHATTTGFRTISLAERPEAAMAIPAVLSSRWPAFMLAGQPGHDVDLTRLAIDAPQHQVLLVDPADEVVGVGLSTPLSWDGTVAGLPSGWDGAVTAGADLLDRGATPNAVSALSITLTPAAAGQGLAAPMIDALKRAAADAGAATLLAPVRPVRKTRYPRTPMGDYLTWRNAHGEVFDPWLRLHLAVGATVLGIADESMRITGTLAQWRGWTGLPLAASGEYVVPGGLAALTVDVEVDLGIYREPNVWVGHRTTD